MGRELISQLATFCDVGKLLTAVMATVTFIAAGRRVTHRQLHKMAIRLLIHWQCCIATLAVNIDL